jgi:hypothetical protein
MNYKLVFIAIPTAGTVKDGNLTEEFLRFFAKLHEQHPEKTFLSPMAQDYQILPFLQSKEANWEVWGHRCRAVLSRCEVVWVLKFPGWDKSVGVAGEIECARDYGIPVQYIEVS